MNDWVALFLCVFVLIFSNTNNNSNPSFPSESAGLSRDSSSSKLALVDGLLLQQLAAQLSTGSSSNSAIARVQVKL